MRVNGDAFRGAVDRGGAPSSGRTVLLRADADSDVESAENVSSPETDVSSLFGGEVPAGRGIKAFKYHFDGDSGAETAGARTVLELATALGERHTGRDLFRGKDILQHVGIGVGRTRITGLIDADIGGRVIEHFPPVGPMVVASRRVPLQV